MRNHPLFSIIMPVYNAENRLKHSIESVLNQTYKQFELIIIDDGSLDNSKKIYKNYSKMDKRITVITKENAGVSLARNSGLEKSRGDYITFIDADDTLEVNTLKRISEEINNNDSDIFIYGMNFDYYNEDVLQNVKVMSFDKDIDIKMSEFKEHFFKLYQNNYLSSVCNKVFKTSIIQKNNLKFEKKMAILEDLKFTLDALSFSNKISIIRASYYHYFNDITKINLTKRPNIDYLSSFKILDHKLREFTLQNGMNSKEDKQEINSMILTYYITGIRQSFSTNKSNIVKFKELTMYTQDEDVKISASNSKPKNKKIKTIQMLLKNNNRLSLFFVFLLHNKIERFKKFFNRKMIL